jgi:predicted transcriptional regulator
MKKAEKVLQEFGLTENETIIYLELLKHQEITPYKISKITNIARSTVYDTLSKLALKGLVELDKNEPLEKQQTLIKAKNPSYLRDHIRKQKKDLTKLEFDIIDILPILKGNYFEGKTNADFRFFPGIEGAKKVYLAECKNTSDLPKYIWTHLMPMDSFGKKFINKVVDLEIEYLKKVKYKPKKIIPLNDWTRHVLAYQCKRNIDYIKTRNIRFIDNPNFSINHRIVVKSDRIRIICAHKDEAWGLIIQSPTLTKTFISFFDIMWALGTKVDEKFVNSLGISV